MSPFMPQSLLMQTLKAIITQRDFAQKIALAQSLKNHTLSIVAPLSSNECLDLKTPGRPQGFESVSPKEVPKRNFKDLQSRIHFLHAIANIELLAIELPALSLLRFGSNNLAFIKRQLEIIAEEALHFSLLQNRLRTLGAEFGTLASHNGLWDYAWQCESELQHQIVIPCYLEARGLDVTPNFIEKFKAIGDHESAHVMQIILTDEIQHVLAGQEYLKEKSSELKLTADELFSQTLNQFFKGKIKSKVALNRANRFEAGFSEKMLQALT